MKILSCFAFCVAIILPQAQARRLNQDEVMKVNKALEQVDLPMLKIKMIDGALHDGLNEEEAKQVEFVQFDIEVLLEGESSFAPLHSKIHLGLNFEKELSLVLSGSGHAPALNDSMVGLMAYAKEKAQEFADNNPEFTLNFNTDNYVENDHNWVYSDLNLDHDSLVHSVNSFHYNLSNQDFFFHSISHFNPTHSMVMEVKKNLNDLLLAVIFDEDIKPEIMTNIMGYIERLSDSTLNYNSMFEQVTF